MKLPTGATRVFLLLAAAFAVLLSLALWREVAREHQNIAISVNALVQLHPRLARSGQVDLVRTDRMAVLLVDPQTQQTAALRIVSPLLLPQAIQIGQAQATAPLKQQAYLLVAITDKDGELFQVTPGEAYGSISATLGEKKLLLELTEVYRGGVRNQGGSPAPTSDDSPSCHFCISGVAFTNLPHQPSANGRLIILLFDPQIQQPVAFQISNSDNLPQAFSIALPPQLRNNAKSAYQLRILTDTNQQPFESAPGEIIGRSPQPIPLGTNDLQFPLDTPYNR